VDLDVCATACGIRLRDAQGRSDNQLK
jgi:hypothetical protein